MIENFLVTVSFLWLGALFLPALLLLLVPGRKGTMRTRREVVHDGISVADACELYARRLEHDRFAVDRSGAPLLLKARRAAQHHRAPGGGDIVTHATKPASVEVRLSHENAGAGGAASAGSGGVAAGGGLGAGNVGSVAVTVEAWLNDFVFHDSGEGRQVDLMLHRLTDADLATEPPPAVPTPSYHALVALAAAVLTCAAPWVVSAVTRDGSMWRTRMVACLVAGPVIALLEVERTLRDARARPAEVTRTWLAYVAAVVAVVGAALCAMALWGRR